MINYHSLLFFPWLAPCALCTSRRIRAVYFHVQSPERVIEGVTLVELVVPAASSVDEDALCSPLGAGAYWSSDHLSTFNSRDEFNSRDSMDDSLVIGAPHDGGSVSGHDPTVRTACAVINLRPFA